MPSATPESTGCETAGAAGTGRAASITGQSLMSVPEILVLSLDGS
jgi:hypothetical protein